MQFLHHNQLRKTDINASFKRIQDNNLNLENNFSVFHKFCFCFSVIDADGSNVYEADENGQVILYFQQKRMS